MNTANKLLVSQAKTPVKKKIGGRQVIVLDHARVDPSHCLADGLFRPLLNSLARQ